MNPTDILYIIKLFSSLTILTLNSATLPCKNWHWSTITTQDPDFLVTQRLLVLTCRLTLKHKQQFSNSDRS